MSIDWEDLCNNCGDCCEMWTSGVACPLYDTQQHQCGDYENRFQKVPECVQLTVENILPLYEKGVLSDRCNYVRSMKGEELLWNVEPKLLQSFHLAPIRIRMDYYLSSLQRKV